ncbi:Crp/Fnr family transcriptional regulator [Pararhodonellum marinum]|uniref:Crp/Fnr family transcriptional regulator n=1 Tax=Pararhodonellum marinum TaxID=2755358 RepID=UPI00188F4BA7|nr:Crp/Fnr family transcriptional regulator [Pararhodonellum marinum]
MQLALDLFLSKGFTAAQSEMLSDHFCLSKNIAEGEYFLQQGHVCQHIALIAKGQFRYYYNTEAGDVTRWISLQGDFMTSLASFIQEKPAVENIQAIKDSELWMIPKSAWKALYANHEFIRQFWLRTMEYNYIGMEERVFNQIALSAEERYRWMLDHYPRFNQEVPDKYIASMLGITPRHLSRIRAQKN